MGIFGIEVPLSANKHNGVAFGGTGGFSEGAMKLIARVVKNRVTPIAESEKLNKEYLAILEGNNQRFNKLKIKKKK